MAADNDLAFDITRCAIDAVSKIPCENMLTNENVSAAPPAIPDRGVPTDTTSGGTACPEIAPEGTFRTANLVVTSRPGFALNYRFVKGANCTFDLEISAEISDIIFGSGGTRPGIGNSASFSDSSSCVDLWPSDFPHTVALTPIEGGETEPPSITYQFIRDPERCAYALDISGTYRDGLTTEKTVFTDLYCEDGMVHGVTETWTFEHGILVASEAHAPTIVDCPPCCDAALACCPGVELDATATATLTINGVTLPSFSIPRTAFELGPPAFWYYSNYPSGTICPFAPHEHAYSVSIECNNNRLALTVDIFLRDFIPFGYWQWDDFSDEHPGRFAFSCDPFHFHWEGFDKVLGTGSDSPATLCGVDMGAAGTNFLVLDVVMP